MGAFWSDAGRWLDLAREDEQGGFEVGHRFGDRKELESDPNSPVFLTPINPVFQRFVSNMP